MRFNDPCSHCILVTSTGGRGGVLASVLDIGVVQPPGIKVSADETDLGGAGGSIFARGGPTNPDSSDPSPAQRVVLRRVTTNRVLFIDPPLGRVYRSLRHRMPTPKTA